MILNCIASVYLAADGIVDAISFIWCLNVWYENKLIKFSLNPASVGFDLKEWSPIHLRRYSVGSGTVLHLLTVGRSGINLRPYVCIARVCVRVVHRLLCVLLSTLLCLQAVQAHRWELLRPVLRARRPHHHAYQSSSHARHPCKHFLSALSSFFKGAITSKIKHAIKLKTSPARLAQL